MSLATRAVTVMLPVEDVDRATKFYVESLGLDHTGTSGEGGALFELDDAITLMLLPRPGGQRSESTAMSWEVDDVESEIDDLQAKGVVFEDYDVPGLKTVDHVATMEGEKAAWFRDPDGNVLCVHQRSS
ncbi:MAG: glyoxalase [Marmoricola sp.]|jgi:catechol 2,3-dioxygenase-like lactoylglutathione lyase family enzyme|nr:glyoxalase [Marmoricola sp.]